MTRLERAKQFMPFAALHGYEKVLKEKEAVRIEKRELTVEEEKKLNEIVLRVKKGDIVSVEHYSTDRYVKVEGVITAIDLTLKFITVVKTKILFANIKEIKLI
ncbi:MAG: YolD-like family protein [Clostridia bacterium]|nr:YolD-like family protein [Clostridia bacterium]